MPKFPKNTDFKLKPKQTGWGSRSTKDLIRDANEAARWKRQREIDAAERGLERKESWGQEYADMWLFDLANASDDELQDDNMNNIRMILIIIFYFIRN